MPRWLEWLLHPRVTRATPLIALLLAAPSLAVGFYADDYTLLASLEQRIPTAATPFDLYHFAPGNPAQNLDLIARGGLPWWSHPEFQLRFLRPLSSALTALDHHLFGENAVGYHVHLLLWYLALVLAVRQFLRRVLRPAAAELATLLFVTDHTHALAVSWIANRHMIVSAVPAVLGLLAQIDYRERGFGPGRWLAPLAMCVALTGSEAALAGLAYWLCYEWLRAPGARLPARLRSIAIPALLAGTYLALYRYLGFGAQRSGGYNDPVASPLRYLRGALENAPLLSADYLLAIPSELTSLISPRPFVVVGALALGVAVWLTRWSWRTLPAAERHSVAWLGAGGAASLLPVLGGFVGGRLLLFPGIAGAAWLATLLLAAFESPRAAAPRRHRADRPREGARGERRDWPEAPIPTSPRRAVGVLAVIHLVLSPILLVGMMLATAALARQSERSADEAEVGSPPAERVVIVSAPDPMLALYFRELRAMRQPGTSSKFCLLSMAPFTHELERTGPSQFVVRAHGPMLRTSFETLFRDSAADWMPGARVQADGATITVARAEAGTPRELAVTLDVPLEDPSVALLAWQNDRLRRIAIPEIGKTTLLPSAGEDIGVR